MDQSLKERLVGAAVLVVLAAIFLPMVLDGPDQPPSAVPATVAAVPAGASTFRYDLEAPLPADGAAPTTAAPAAAATPTTAAPAAAPVVATKPASTPATKTAAAPAPTATEPKPAAAPKPAPKPEPAVSGAWAAQVGSFSKQATADGVAADLKAKGFKAFVVPHKDGKTTLYRVRVGPVATRDAADALAKKITAKTGQAARPVPHP